MKAYKPYIVLILAALLTAAAGAAPASGAAVLGGTVAVGLDVGLAADSVLVLPLSLKLEVRPSLGENSAAYALIGFDGANNVLLEQAYIDLYYPHVDLRLGRQRIAWGTTDWLSPTDNLNPVDYRRPYEEDNRVAVTAVKLDFYPGDWQCELVWVPVFAPAPLPGPDSPWYVPLPPGLIPVQAVMPAGTPADSEYGLRVARSGGGIDFSFSYFDGWNDLPDMHVDLGLGTITPIYHRQRIIGADFALTRGSFAFMGETAYFITEDSDRVDPEIKNPYFLTVLGLDYTVSDRLLLNTQAVWMYVTPSVGIPEPGEDGMLGITLAVDYRPSIAWRLQCGGMYNCTDQDYLLQPIVEWLPADGLSLSFGAVMLGGPAGTEFGRFGDQDYLFVRVEAAF